MGHVPVLKGVKGTSVRLLPLNIRTRLAEQCDPNHRWQKKLFLCLTPALCFGLLTRLGMSLPIPLTGGPSLRSSARPGRAGPDVRKAWRIPEAVGRPPESAAGTVLLTKR